MHRLILRAMIICGFVVLPAVGQEERVGAADSAAQTATAPATHSNQAQDEQIGQSSAPAAPPPSEKTMAIQTNPFSLISGSLLANYEIMLGGKHGICAEGAYGFLSASSGYQAGLQYRLHMLLRPAHHGMSSPFVGFFGRYYHWITEMQDPTDKTITYKVEETFMHLGANWGRRWIWGPGISMVFRIGYGLPLIADFKWLSAARPENADVIERLFKVVEGVDAELTVGWAF